MRDKRQRGTIPAATSLSGIGDFLFAPASIAGSQLGQSRRDTTSMQQNSLLSQPTAMQPNLDIPSNTLQNMSSVFSQPDTINIVAEKIIEEDKDKPEKERGAFYKGLVRLGGEGGVNQGLKEFASIINDAFFSKRGVQAGIEARELAREKAQPKALTVSQMRAQIANKVRMGQKLDREDYNLLSVIDPEGATQYLVDNPNIFDFDFDDLFNQDESESKDGLPIIKTEEQRNNLPEGAAYIYEGKEYKKGN